MFTVCLLLLFIPLMSKYLPHYHADDNNCASGPQELVQQTRAAAKQAGISYEGENALDMCNPSCDANKFKQVHRCMCGPVWGWQKAPALSIALMLVLNSIVGVLPSDAALPDEALHIPAPGQQSHAAE